MTKFFWISYDFGLKGDYESIYTWLDSHDAKECGDSFAYIKKYSFKSDFIEELKADLSTNVNLKKKDRIYIIYKKDDGSISGLFLYGSRKRNPWEGFASGTGESEDTND